MCQYILLISCLCLSGHFPPTSLQLNLEIYFHPAELVHVTDFVSVDITLGKSLGTRK
jgi:hypothetical protein